MGSSLARVKCETSQVLLAGGQVFFLVDLTFSPHLEIASARLKMSEIILTVYMFLAHLYVYLFLLGGRLRIVIQALLGLFISLFHATKLWKIVIFDSIWEMGPGLITDKSIYMCMLILLMPLHLTTEPAGVPITYMLKTKSP